MPVIRHRSHRYQESRSELIVTFVSGKTYAYGLVPKRVYEDFR